MSCRRKLRLSLQLTTSPNIGRWSYGTGEGSVRSRAVNVAGSLASYARIRVDCGRVPWRRIGPYLMQGLLQ